MQRLCVSLGTTLMLLAGAVPVARGQADVELRDKVRDALSKAKLDKGLNVFTAEDGAPGVSLRGRVATADIRKKIIGISREIVGAKPLDVQFFWAPAIDLVVKTNLTTTEAHKKAYVAALREGYLMGGLDAAYTDADGPSGDGVVPFRVVIEHTTAVAFGDSIVAHTMTGTIFRLNKETVFGTPAGKDGVVAEKLGPGHQFYYSMTAREKGTIRYTFQKWDETKYKDLYTASFPTTAFTSKDVVVSEAILGPAPPKAPLCSLDFETARDLAILNINPLQPDKKALSAKCSATFSGAVEPLVKKIGAGTKDRIAIEILVHNNSPWPMSSASFYLMDSFRAKMATSGTVQGSVEIFPRLLPGEKRMVTAKLFPVGRLYGPAFTSRALSVVNFVPQFDPRGVVE